MSCQIHNVTASPQSEKRTLDYARREEADKGLGQETKIGKQPVGDLNYASIKCNTPGVILDPHPAYDEKSDVGEEILRGREKRPAERIGYPGQGKYDTRTDHEERKYAMRWNALLVGADIFRWDYGCTLRRPTRRHYCCIQFSIESLKNASQRTDADRCSPWVVSRETGCARLC